MSGRKPPPLTPLGKALRERDADLRSAWERDYDAAVTAALSDNVARLVDLLRAHRPPTDSDLDRLADYIEVTAKRHRGGERDGAVHAAAQIAEAIMSTFPRRVPDAARTAAIKIGCDQVERECGAPVNHERVRDLLSRPKKRRRLR
jgi:hypothetical protein